MGAVIGNFLGAGQRLVTGTTTLTENVVWPWQISPMKVTS